MKNLFKFILIFGFVTLPFFSFAQKLKTPDDLDGFRNFKFYTQISHYPNYKFDPFMTIQDDFLNDNNELLEVEVILPDDEKYFLGTEITSLYLDLYENRIVEIEINLKDDIGAVLKHLFKNSDNVKVPKSKDGLLSIFSTRIHFIGRKNEILYVVTHNALPLPPTYSLKIKAINYMDKIGTELVQEQYNTYMNDFGLKHNPNNRIYYKIPLFKSGGNYFVRILFGNVVDNLVLDTGSNNFIISKMLYDKLKAKGLVTDQNSFSKFTLANGKKETLKKVLIKEVQLYDLKIKNVEAYVNTSDNISLLGQSFLKRFGSISIDYRLDVLTIKK